MSDQLAPRGRPRRAWVPLVIVSVGLLATAGFAGVVARVALSARVARFHDVVERAIATLDGRLATHQASVSAAAAVLGAGGSIDAAEFERLAANLETQEPAPVMVAWCEKSSTASDGACPVVKLWSRSPLGDMAPSSDLTYLGDLRPAMARASAGRVSAVALMRQPGTDRETDIAFVFPVLGPADFPERSKGTVRGFVVSAFDAHELLRATLKASSRSVDVEIRDGGLGDGALLLRTVHRGHHPAFSYEHVMEVGGRHWSLRFGSTPEFDGEGRETLVRLVWAAGVLVTLLFTALSWFEFRARARAEHIGRKLRDADEGLRKASRAKDEFLAMLGHELRNPLGAISNALKVLRMRNGSDAVGQRALSIAERQVEHQSRLVDDLLDLTRLGAGKIALEPVRLDARDIVRRAVASVRAALDEQRHSLTLELASEPAELMADPTRLEQIVVNLLTNAIKYTPARGSIEVSVTREVESRQVVIAVRDDGIGIDAGALENVFSPFVQNTTNSPDQRGGLGIGLSIVRRLVELHGGSVTASSAGPGKGSVFKVRLPACRRSKYADPRPRLRPEVSARAARKPPLDVLIVEDMADNREMLAELVTMFGHNVREAKTGDEALALVREQPPELALVDLGLPDMDGFEVARRLRAVKGGEKIVLVAVTGFGSPEDRSRALRAGFDRHLVKPLAVESLVELLGRPSSA